MLYRTFVHICTRLYHTHAYSKSSEDSPFLDYKTRTLMAPRLSMGSMCRQWIKGLSLTPLPSFPVVFGWAHPANATYSYSQRMTWVDIICLPLSPQGPLFGFHTKHPTVQITASRGTQLPKSLGSKLSPGPLWGASLSQVGSEGLSYLWRLTIP